MTRTSPNLRPQVARNAKDAISQLSAPGPHRALRGDLGMTGTPGVVFAPEAGLGLPAVVFAHDWLQPAERYADLLRHLATWGFVTAAPSNHKGILPSHPAFAADLRTTLGICAGVRLGDGKISVDARHTALVGHGIGGGVALMAAVGLPRLQAVITIAAAQTHPGVIEAARELKVPALHIAAGKDVVAAPEGHAHQIAAATGGPTWLRTIPKAGHTGFLDGNHWSDLLLAGRPDAKVRRLTRALVTAFLLRHLCEDRSAEVLVDGKVPGTALAERDEDKKKSA